MKFLRLGLLFSFLIIVGCTPPFSEEEKNKRRKANQQRMEQERKAREQERKAREQQKNIQIKAFEAVVEAVKAHDCLKIGEILNEHGHAVRANPKRKQLAALVKKEMLELAAGAETEQAADALESLFSQVDPPNLRPFLVEARQKLVKLRLKQRPGTILLDVADISRQMSKGELESVKAKLYQFFHARFSPAPIELGTSSSGKPFEYFARIAVIVNGSWTSYGYNHSLPGKITMRIFLPDSIRGQNKDSYTFSGEKHLPRVVRMNRVYPHFREITGKIYKDMEEIEVPDTIDEIVRISKEKLQQGPKTVAGYYHYVSTSKTEWDAAIFEALQKKLDGAISREKKTPALGTVSVAISGVPTFYGSQLTKHTTTRNTTPVFTTATAHIDIETSGGSSSLDGKHVVTAKYEPPETTRETLRELAARAANELSLGLKRKIAAWPDYKPSKDTMEK